MSGYIKPRDQKILCYKSYNRCAIPECRKELVLDKAESDNNSIIGMIAHIVGENEGSARYDALFPEDKRNGNDNLIMVCANCHKMIDDQPDKYTVERLHRIKKEHEEWAQKSLKSQVINVTYVELSVVTSYLMSGQASNDENYTIIPPKEKINKNALSSSIEQLIIMGLTQVKQVASFLENCPDMDFGKRLKESFVNEYNRLVTEEKLSGDDLFNGLLEFASGRSSDFKQKAAGLTVLVYLFEKCDVFEK
jgi:hypothetical protein